MIAKFSLAMVSFSQGLEKKLQQIRIRLDSGCGSNK
jgi:hypothetical protein